MLRAFPAHVSFPLTPVSEAEVVSLECLRRPNQMDTIHIKTMLDRNEIDPFVSAGSPLVVSWGNRKQEKFEGYVHTHRPIAEGFQRWTEIIGVSVAYPMVTERNRAFYNVGVHNVAEQIADDYGLDSEIDKHPFQHDQIIQRSQSDWTFLQRLAHQVGFVLMVDRATLMFRNIDKIYDESLRNVRLSRTFSNVVTANADVLEFVPDYSATPFDGSPATRNALYGVTPWSREIFGQEEQSSEPFRETVVDRVVQIAAESEFGLEAENRLGKFPYRAKARLRTPFKVRPFDSFLITHDGVESLWTVLQIKHVVGEEYYGDVVLGSTGEPPPQSLRRTAVDQMDVSALLDYQRKTKRAVPVILETLPYSWGTGASVLNTNQRWRAERITVDI